LTWAGLRKLLLVDGSLHEQYEFGCGAFFIVVGWTVFYWWLHVMARETRKHGIRGAKVQRESFSGKNKAARSPSSRLAGKSDSELTRIANGGGAGLGAGRGGLDNKTDSELELIANGGAEGKAEEFNQIKNEISRMNSSELRRISEGRPEGDLFHFQKNNAEARWLLIAMLTIFVGGGVGMYLVTKSFLVLFTSLFLPPQLLSLIFLYNRWRGNDFRWLQVRSLRKNTRTPETEMTTEEEVREDMFLDNEYAVRYCCDPRGDTEYCCDPERGETWWQGDFRRTHVCVAFCHGGLSHTDYVTLFGLLTLFGSAALWGVLTFVLEPDTWAAAAAGNLSSSSFALTNNATTPVITADSKRVGPVLAMVIYTLLFTLAPLTEHFNTLRAFSDFRNGLVMQLGIAALIHRCVLD